MQIGLKFKNKKIDVGNVKKLSEFEKIIGLMFRAREKSPAMLFEFKKPTKIKIHSLFVFFPSAAVWLNDENKVVDLKIIKPFKLAVSCKKSFYKLLEIPFNKKYNKTIKSLFEKCNHF